MYLSKVQLDITKRKTQLALEAPGKLHGAVESAFSVRQERTLWRIDKLGERMYLLIVSEDIPDLSVISAQFGYAGDKGELKNYDPFLNQIKEQTRWRFRLVANPTFQEKYENGRGKKRAHVYTHFQMDWLYKKAEMNGFRIIPDFTQIVSSSWKTFFRSRGSQTESYRKVRFREVTYEGILEVMNEELFRQALIRGIGREKAYGMGMLTVIRV